MGFVAPAERKPRAVRNTSGVMVIMDDELVDPVPKDGAALHGFEVVDFMFALV
jgi:hypothetical protein